MGFTTVVLDIDEVTRLTAEIVKLKAEVEALKKELEPYRKHFGNYERPPGKPVGQSQNAD